MTRPFNLTKLSASQLNTVVGPTAAIARQYLRLGESLEMQSGVALCNSSNAQWRP
jgi:hypothetical protein